MPLDFPGFTDIYVDLSTLDLGALSAASWTAWFNVDAIGAGDEQHIMAKADGTGAGSRDWSMQIEETPDILRGVLDTGAGGDNVNGVTLITPVVWHFAAMTYDGINTRIYLDGIQDGINAQTGNIVSGTGKPALLAALDDGSIKRQLDGLLDDTRIYNRALTPNEILTMFTLRGKDNIINGMLHQWKMSELAPGIAATVANSIIDFGSAQFNGDPILAPTYETGILA